MDFMYPQSQKSQGFKSGDLGGQAVGNCSSDDSVVIEMETEPLFHTTRNLMYTVNGHRYASLLELSVISALKARQCDKTTIFMQDGAQPHNSCYLK